MQRVAIVGFSQALGSSALGLMQTEKPETKACALPDIAKKI